jgi:pimeloyl-ACP methyl ester carboxylesterase
MNAQPIDVPVDGGALRALSFGTGSRLIVAAHGITASGMSFRSVARQLPPGWRLVAVDLRGRGGSAHLPGPFGMDRHAADLQRVTEHLGNGDPVVLTGQSMGAYAALRAAATRPELVERLVLIDGGLPLPVPEGADPDQLLDVTLGPAIARLYQTYPSEEAYLDVFRNHPALAGTWNDDAEAYVRYDITGDHGALRSRVNPDAVRADGRDLITGGDLFGADLRALVPPTLVLVAPAGMFGQPPGLLPWPLVEHWRRQAPELRAELVPDTNHYTILLSDPAATIVAARLTDASSWAG